jgi:hypothetical protein
LFLRVGKNGSPVAAVVTPVQGHHFSRGRPRTIEHDHPHYAVSEHCLLIVEMAIKREKEMADRWISCGFDIATGAIV